MPSKNEESSLDLSVQFLKERQQNIEKAKQTVSINKDLDRRLNIDMKFNATQAPFKKVIEFVKNKVLTDEMEEESEIKNV